MVKLDGNGSIITTSNSFIFDSHMASKSSNRQAGINHYLLFVCASIKPFNLVSEIHSTRGTCKLAFLLKKMESLFNVRVM